MGITSRGDRQPEVGPDRQLVYIRIMPSASTLKPLVYTMLDQTPAPPGWFVYYIDRDAHSWWSLPVALWVLVEHDSDDTSEYRPFVVGKLGKVIDYEASPDAVLCVLPPGIDHKLYVEALLPKPPTQPTAAPVGN